MSGFEITGDNELHLADFALMPYNSKFDFDLDFEVLARICMSASVHDVDEMSAVSDMWRRFLIYDAYLYIAQNKDTGKSVNLVTIAQLLQGRADGVDLGDRVAEEYGIRMILDWRTCPVTETSTVLESSATGRPFLATRRNKLYKYGHGLVESHTATGQADIAAPLAYLSEHTFLSPTIGPKVETAITPFSILIPTISTRANISNGLRNVRLCDRAPDHRTKWKEVRFRSHIFDVNSHARMLNIFGETEVNAFLYAGHILVDAPVLHLLPFSLRTPPKPPPTQQNSGLSDKEDIVQKIRDRAGTKWSSIKSQVEQLADALSNEKSTSAKKKGAKSSTPSEDELVQMFTSLDRETQAYLIGHIHLNRESLFNSIFSHGKHKVAHLIDGDWSHDWTKSAFEQYAKGILTSDDPAKDYALHTFTYFWRIIESILTVPNDALPTRKRRIRDQLVNELENLLFESDYETVYAILNKETECIETVLRLCSDSSLFLKGLFASHARSGALGRIFAGLHCMANSCIIMSDFNIDNTKLIEALGKLTSAYIHLMAAKSKSTNITTCLKAMQFRMTISYDMQSIMGFAFGSGRVTHSPEFINPLRGLFGRKVDDEDDDTIEDRTGIYASAKYSLYAPLELYTNKVYWPIDAYVAGKISDKDVPIVSDASVVDRVKGRKTTPNKIDWAIKEYGDTNPIVRFYCARVLNEQNGHYLRIGDYKWSEIKSEPDTVTIETSATAT